MAILNPTSLAALTSILQEATYVKRNGDTYRSPTWIRRLSKISLFSFVLAAIGLVVVASSQYKSRPAINSTDIWALEIAFFIYSLTGLLYLFLMTLSAVHQCWHLRQASVPVIWARLRLDIHADVVLLKQLGSCDKATLEYALLQYRHCWNSLHGRVSLLAGDLRKIGLFPTFAVSAMAASTLLKNDSNIFVWAPLLATCFHLVALHVRLELHRPQQVMDLLEFAIRHSEDKAES